MGGGQSRFFSTLGEGLTVNVYPTCVVGAQAQAQRLSLSRLVVLRSRAQPGTGISPRLNVSVVSIGG